MNKGLGISIYNQQWYRPLELLAQIHDSIVFQVPLNTPWKVQAEMLLRIKESLESPLSGMVRKLRLPLISQWGFNMCKDEMIEMKSKQIPSDPEKLADKLRDNYFKLRSKSLLPSIIY